MSIFSLVTIVIVLGLYITFCILDRKLDRELDREFRKMYERMWDKEDTNDSQTS